MKDVPQNLMNKDRSRLVPEGYYKAGHGIDPAWLMGRRVRLVHELGPQGFWYVVARVRRKGQIVDEWPRRWRGRLLQLEDGDATDATNP